MPKWYKMTLYTSGSRIWVAGPRFCPQAWPGAIVLNHHEPRVLISLQNSSGSRHKNKIQHHATQSNILQYLQFKPNFQYVAISCNFNTLYATEAMRTPNPTAKMETAKFNAHLDPYKQSEATEPPWRSALRRWVEATMGSPCQRWAISAPTRLIFFMFAAFDMFFKVFICSFLQFIHIQVIYLNEYLRIYVSDLLLFKFRQNICAKHVLPKISPQRPVPSPLDCC